LPLAGIEILIYDANLNRLADTVTDANGAFRIALPAGAYVVAAADPLQRYATQFFGGGAQIVVVAGHDAAPLAITLAAATPANGRRRSVHH
jgi:hypothetical protein